MPRQAEAKLTSEERCEKAFNQWFLKQSPFTLTNDDQLDWTRLGWQACWRYLQEHLAEYIAS